MIHQQEQLHFLTLREKLLGDTYYVYRISESQKYITGDQDGVYYLTLLNASNRPTVSPFNEEKYSQPVKQLFPQTDRDNPTSDPEESQCFADPNTIGLVDINDPRKSVTKETLNKYLDDFKVGFGLTDISSATGTAHTIHSDIDHGLNRVIKLNVVSGGANYGIIQEPKKLITMQTLFPSEHLRLENMQLQKLL